MIPNHVDGLTGNLGPSIDGLTSYVKLTALLASGDASPLSPFRF